MHISTSNLLTKQRLSYSFYMYKKTILCIVLQAISERQLLKYGKKFHQINSFLYYTLVLYLNMKGINLTKRKNQPYS